MDASEPAWNPGLLEDALRRVSEAEREQAREAEGRGWSALLERILPGWASTPSLPRLALAVQLSLLIVLGAALLTTGGGESQTAGGASTVGPAEK